MANSGLTPDQIAWLQAIVQQVQREGHGMVVIKIEHGVPRYIIPAPSLDFLGRNLQDYREDRKNDNKS